MADRRPGHVGTPGDAAHTHRVDTTDDLGQAWSRTQAALPDGWTCPNCDAPKSKFMVLADE